MIPSTSDVARCCSRASASSRLHALSCWYSSARDSRIGPTRVLTFVPVERSLRPRVGLFAPLRDKVTSSAQSLVPLSAGTPVQSDAPAVHKAPRSTEPSVAKRPYKIGNPKPRSVAPFAVHVDDHVTGWRNVTSQIHRYSWIATGPLARDFSLLDDGLRPVTAGGIDLAWAVANLAPKEPVITDSRRVRCSQRGPRWFECRGRQCCALISDGSTHFV